MVTSGGVQPFLFLSFPSLCDSLLKLIDVDAVVFCHAELMCMAIQAWPWTRVPRRDHSQSGRQSCGQHNHGCFVRFGPHSRPRRCAASFPSASLHYHACVCKTPEMSWLSADDGSVYTTGLNDAGQLGHSHDSPYVTVRPSQPDTKRPQASNIFPSIVRWLYPCWQVMSRCIVSGIDCFLGLLFRKRGRYSCPRRRRQLQQAVSTHWCWLNQGMCGLWATTAAGNWG